MASLTVPGSLDALADLRAARRRRRLESWNVIDALYRAYVTALVSVIAVVTVSGVVGDDRLGPDGIADARRHGPAAVGLLVALALAAGLRSGARGGPLAIEAADVRHVLLAPVDRGHALRPLVLRQLRFVVFAGGATGGAAGLVAYHRLDANPAQWIASGAVAGATTGLAFTASGLVACGRRLPRSVAGLAGGLLLAWSVGDLALASRTSPATLVGGVACWPLRVVAADVLGVAAIVAVTAAGVASIGGLSVEQAARRGWLVSHLKFAATFQDLRSVLLLRRQLAAEVPRPRPWFGVPRSPGRWFVWRRDLAGVSRWPVARVARVAFLGVVAGLAAVGAWAGTALLVVVSGACLFVAALDATEGLAQEVDHPTRRDSYPVPRGALHLHHLSVPVAVMIVVTLVAAGAAAVAGGTDALAVGLALALPAALAAVAGAAVATLRNPPQPGVLVADSAGLAMLFHQVLPPAIATVAPASVLLAREAVQSSGASPFAAAAGVAPLALGVAALAFGWVRHQDAIADALAVAGR